VRKNNKKHRVANQSRTIVVGMRPGLTLIKKTIADLGIDITTFARNAKRWWMDTHGRLIKAGHVKEVIHAFQRNTLKPPKWLTDYIQRGLTTA